MILYMCILICLACYNSLFVVHGLSKQCDIDFNYYKDQARLGATWALRILDSGTKAPDGFMLGHWAHVGNFDECIATKEPEERFRGKYCLAQLTYNETKQKSPLIPVANYARFIQWGVCVPSSCTAEDASMITSEVAASLPPPLGPLEVAAEITENTCYVIEPYSFDVGFWMFVALQCVLFSIVLLATFVNLPKRNHLLLSNTPHDGGGKHESKSGMRLMLSAFDVRKNAQYLFGTKHVPGSMTSVDGVRAITMLWIMIGHRITNDFNAISSNYLYNRTLYTKFYAMPLMNSFVAVDTFFLLSGMLVYMTCSRALAKNQFSAIKYYVYRYLRISAPVSVLLLYYMFVLPYTGPGPRFYQDAGQLVGICREWWWTSLTYVQNYIGEPCKTETWYLSADMQLAFLAPLLIIPLHAAPRAGRQLAIIALLVSCFIPFTIAYVYKLFWAFHSTDPELNHLFSEKMYGFTHNRASPYIFGIIFGHILITTRKMELKFLTKRWLVLTLWVIAIIVCAAVVYSLTFAYQEWHGFDPVNSAFYNGFHHVGWAMGLSWIIFACVRGYGGPINALLSWGGWLPLSRASFCMYLVQYIWFTLMMGLARVPMQTSILLAFHHFTSDLIPVFLIACYLHLTVEAPAMHLLRRLLK